MKSKILFLLIILFPSLVFSQAVPTSKIAWDQAALNLADAQAMSYKYYPDGATAGVTLVSVACTGTASPFQCTANFPAFTPGSHNLTLTASNMGGESVKSASFAFTFVAIPSAPANISIK